VKERLDLYGKRADDIEHLLSVLLGLSTIYSIALALSAYAQVKDSAKKIDDLTGDAKAEVRKSYELTEKTKADILKIFPMFETIESRVNFMMHHLLDLLPRLDLHEKTYADLSGEEKEQIFYYEKSVSALEIFNVKPFSDQISGIFHGLGSFYALKYEHGGRGTREDRERSIFYLEKAVALDGKNVKALNDRGYLALRIDAQPDYDTAKKYLKQSLGIDDDQQRPRYNLAYIAHMQKDYKESVAQITEALDRHKWQVSPYAPRRLDLYYQRACSYVRLGINPDSNAVKVDYFEFAVKDLKVIAEHPDTDWKGILEAFCGTKEIVGDKDNGGDLYPLIAPEYTSGNAQEKLNKTREEAGKIFEQFLGKRLIN